MRMRFTRRRTIASLLAVGSLAAVTQGIAADASSQMDSPEIIHVRAKPGAFSGALSFRDMRFPCMVGRTGIVHPKHEGDGGTPAGVFPLCEVRYRADRISAPATGLLVVKTRQSDGWCDDPKDPSYNRIVHLPYRSNAEAMWRDDHLYDVLAVIGYNITPTVPGAGSAIFLHVMRPSTDDHQYTAGCVSLELPDLLAVLAACTPSTRIDIRTS